MSAVVRQHSTACTAISTVSTWLVTGAHPYFMRPGCCCVLLLLTSPGAWHLVSSSWCGSGCDVTSWRWYNMLCSTCQCWRVWEQQQLTVMNWSLRLWQDVLCLTVLKYAKYLRKASHTTSYSNLDEYSRSAAAVVDHMQRHVVEDVLPVAVPSSPNPCRL